jgi:hypothetical protein
MRERGSAGRPEAAGKAGRWRGEERRGRSEVGGRKPEVGGGADRWSSHVNERGGREEEGGRWAVWAEREGELHGKKERVRRKRGGSGRWEGREG